MAKTVVRCDDLRGLSGSVMRIALESPGQPEIVDLIAELDAYQQALYPSEFNHLLDLTALHPSRVLFAVARDAQAHAAGCGAIVLAPDFGELKRWFVRPQNRGQGTAKALYAFLEREAVGKGCGLLKLETGVSQPEALRLYQQAGFVRCGPYAAYTDNPFSVFMEKKLGAACRPGLSR